MPKAVPIIIALIGICMASPAQDSKLKGTYCRSYETTDIFDCITFSGNDSFERSSGGHLGVERYGSGHYSSENGILILRYNKTTPKEMGFYQNTSWTNKKDTISITFVITDFDGVPIQGANIHSPTLQKGAIADEGGKAIISAAKSVEDIRIDISYIDFDYLKLVLEGHLNQEIRACLQNTWGGNPVIDQVDTLIISESSADRFITNTNAPWLRRN